MTFKFISGTIVLTPRVLDTIPWAETTKALFRHLEGDWGCISEAAKAVNEDALHNDGPLLSSYLTDTGKEFLIITEADRSATTILLPEER